jgi:pimeloyl-ACP methyl ester carboxylesterase
MSRRTVRVGEVELAVIEAGSGPPLLLVHGFPLDHSMWSEQLSALAARHRVIAPDLRGFGSSSATPGVVTMERMADDLAELLTAMGIAEPVTFCGLSMGGYIAWQFWRRHAARLRALVLCDTRAIADAPDAAKNRLTLAERVEREGTATVAEAMVPKLFGPDVHKNHPERVEAMRRVILAANPVGIAAALRGMAERPSAEAWLPEIRVPALLVVGRDDAISPAAEMRTIADRMPNARFVEILAAGHMSPLENPAAVNEAILAFTA